MGHRPFRGTPLLVLVALYALTPVVIVAHVIRRPGVDREAFFGGVAAYLLIGMTYAFAYVALGEFPGLPCGTHGDPADISAVAGVLLATVCGLVLTAIWRHNLADLAAKPFTSLYDGGSQDRIPKPAYSIAQSRQKKGKYLEAIAEIRKQLDRFPTDVEGQMLLAQIQAEDLKDLPAAELTIERFCAQPGHAPQNIVVALYSLADWHLQDRPGPRGGGAGPGEGHRAVPRIGIRLGRGAPHRSSGQPRDAAGVTRRQKKFIVPKG